MEPNINTADLARVFGKKLARAVSQSEFRRPKGRTRRSYTAGCRPGGRGLFERLTQPSLV